MTVSFDIMNTLRIASVTFDLEYGQEFSRQASGRTLVKDLRSPLWRAKMQSSAFFHDELNDLQALFDGLDGSISSFPVWNPTRRFPRQDPTGSLLGSSAPAIAVVGGNNKTLSIKGLPAGYALSRGDMIGFTYGSAGVVALHRVIVGGVANGGGTTGLIEVRPHIRPGAAANDSVVLAKPYCMMMVVPGSYDPEASLQTGSISFEAVQVINA